MPWIKPTNNVDSIASVCALKCSIDAKFDFCSQTREINFEGDPVGLIESGKEYTCYDLSKETTFGIDKCPSLCSELEAAEIVEEEPVAE